MRWNRGSGNESDNCRDDDSNQDGARKLANRENRQRYEAEHGYQRGVRGQMSRLDRSAGHSERNQSRLVQPYKGEEQSNSDGEAVAQASGHALHNPLAQAQHRHQDKQNAGNKYGGKSSLPREA